MVTISGFVNRDGKALVPVSISRSRDSDPLQLNAWIDTAFTGDFAFSETLIQQMGLRKAAGTWAVYADGTTKRIDAFTCFID